MVKGSPSTVSVSKAKAKQRGVLALEVTESSVGVQSPLLESWEWLPRRVTRAAGGRRPPGSAQEAQLAGVSRQAAPRAECWALSEEGLWTLGEPVSVHSQESWQAPLSAPPAWESQTHSASWVARRRRAGARPSLTLSRPAMVRIAATSGVHTTSDAVWDQEPFAIRGDSRPLRRRPEPRSEVETPMLISHLSRRCAARQHTHRAGNVSLEGIDRTRVAL